MESCAGKLLPEGAIENAKLVLDSIFLERQQNEARQKLAAAVKSGDAEILQNAIFSAKTIEKVENLSSFTAILKEWEEKKAAADNLKQILSSDIDIGELWEAILVAEKCHIDVAAEKNRHESLKLIHQNLISILASDAPASAEIEQARDEATKENLFLNENFLSQLENKFEEAKTREETAAAESSLANALKSRAKSSILNVLNSGASWLSGQSKEEAEKTLREIEREEEQARAREALKRCLRGQ